MKVIRPRFDEPQRKPLLPEISLSPRDAILWAMRVLAVLAVIGSGYLAWKTLGQQGEVGCGAGFACDEVLASRWSKWLGFPVAVPAFSLYASLLIALAFCSASAKQVQELAWKAACWLSLIAAGAAIWFIVLQAFVVGHYCSWCLAVHACGIVLAALAITLQWKTVSTVLVGVAASVLGVAILAGGQWLQGEPSTEVAFEEQGASSTNGPPVRLNVDSAAPAPTDDLGTKTTPSAQPTNGIPPNEPPNWLDDLLSAPPPSDDLLATEPPKVVEANPGGLFDPPPPPVEGSQPVSGDTTPQGASPEATDLPKQRIISLLDRKAEIDVYQHPILGSPKATHVVVKLFDYTCPHCRTMHGHLQVARERFGPDFAVLMLPVPMNSNCNHFIRSTDFKHLHACELAKLALAVWRADPAKFEAFDTWAFAPELPPTPAQARAKAVALVGELALARELDDWRLNDRLAVGVKLYGLAGMGAIPKVLVPPGGVIRGRVENRGEVLTFLQKVLGVTDASTPPRAVSPEDEDLVP